MERRTVYRAIVEGQIQPAAASRNSNAAGRNFEWNNRTKRSRVNQRAVAPIIADQIVRRVRVLPRRVEIKADAGNRRDRQRGGCAGYGTNAIGDDDTKLFSAVEKREVRNRDARPRRARDVHTVGLPLIAERDKRGVGGNRRHTEDRAIPHGRGLVLRLGGDDRRGCDNKKEVVADGVAIARHGHGIGAGITGGHGTNRERIVPVRSLKNRRTLAPGVAERSRSGGRRRKAGGRARAIRRTRGRARNRRRFDHEQRDGARGRPAILPHIEGRAWITGFHTYCLDAGDPYPEGYVVADSWGVTGTMSQ